MLFSAVDECDNSTTTSATFTTEDHIGPDIQAPAQDIVIDCSQSNAQATFQNWFQSQGGAIASDGCSEITWISYFPVLPDTCNGTINSWTVEFKAGDGCGNINSTIAVVTFTDVLSGTTGPFLSEPGFTISPNPVKDILRIELTDIASTLERITLFNTYGQTVMINREKSKDIFLPVNGLTPGLYYLRAETSNGIGTRKVFIE